MRGRRLSFYAHVLRQVLVRRGRLALFVVASTMHALGHAALAVAAGALLATLAGGGLPRSAGSTWLVHVGPGAGDPFVLGIVGLGAVLTKAIAGAIATWVQATVAGDVGCGLRAELLDAWIGVHRLRRPRHDDHGADVGARAHDVGEHARRVAALTLRVRDVEAGLEGVLGGLRAIGQLLPLAVVLVLISPRLAGAALLVLVPFALVLGSARRRWKRAHLRAAEDGDALLEAAEEAIRHGDLWATYGASAKISTHVARLGHLLTAHTARLHASAAAMTGANEVLGALALVCALGAGRAGWLGAGELPLVAFAVPFFLAYRPLRELTEARLALARATAAYDALPAASDAHDVTSDDVASEESREWPLEDLALENVGLVYGHGDTFDLTLRAGEIVALAGPTGSGKTTLLRTLLGLESLRAGDIRYGTKSLCSAGIGPSSRPFAWVPQDAPLLADTLDANVMLAAKDTTTEAMLAAIGAARLVADVGDAKLAGGPARVSGGERQWIVLARAIATRLPILLLDEPTSGLDEESQRRVLDAIVRLRGERTVLIVTHRPEPLAIADRVIRLGPAVEAPREVSGLTATG